MTKAYFNFKSQPLRYQTMQSFVILQMSSNGVFKSPMHKAVTNSEREMISLTSIYIPELHKDTAPLEGLISESTPRLYKTI